MVLTKRKDIIFCLFKHHVARHYWCVRLCGDALGIGRMSLWSVLSTPHTQHRMSLSSSPLQNLPAIISTNGNATATARAAKWRHWAVNTDTTTAVVGGGVQTGGYEEGNLVRPKWTGETPLSRLVRALISFKPLYSFLKLGARQVLIRFIISSPIFDSSVSWC